LVYLRIIVRWFCLLTNFWLLEVVMWWKRKHTRVAGPLIVWIALLLSGGVSKAVGETLYAPTFGELGYAPTLAEPVYAPKLGESVYEPAVGEPVYVPTYTAPGRFVRGKFTTPELVNAEYLRCAKLEGFDERLNCALESLGITQEEIE
jgi:hypothetical protein